METQTEIYVNTDSGEGLLPVGTKPLSEQMLTHFGHAMRYVSLWGLKMLNVLNDLWSVSVLVYMLSALWGLSVLNVYYVTHGVPVC